MKILLPVLTAFAFLALASVKAAPERHDWASLAKKGDVPAMISLGVMYHTGDGVELDYGKGDGLVSSSLCQE